MRILQKDASPVKFMGNFIQDQCHIPKPSPCEYRLEFHCVQPHAFACCFDYFPEQYYIDPITEGLELVEACELQADTSLGLGLGMQ